MHPGKHISQPITPISGNQGLDLSTSRGWAHSDDGLFARASQNVVRHFDSWYLDDKGPYHKSQRSFFYPRLVHRARSLLSRGGFLMHSLRVPIFNYFLVHLFHNVNHSVPIITLLNLFLPTKNRPLSS